MPSAAGSPSRSLPNCRWSRHAGNRPHRIAPRAARYCFCRDALDGYQSAAQVAGKCAVGSALGRYDARVHAGLAARVDRVTGRSHCRVRLSRAFVAVAACLGLNRALPPKSQDSTNNGCKSMLYYVISSPCPPYCRSQEACTCRISHRHPPVASWARGQEPVWYRLRAICMGLPCRGGGKAASSAAHRAHRPRCSSLRGSSLRG